ncbi:MAG: YhbY family RNA-binding protein [Candidatus Bathyarchaeota archaeon]|jgi:RNA-binding protein|nr:YhbY family RNA-binding protein [Candidatus Bathyarchaeota archaeon]
MGSRKEPDKTRISIAWQDPAIMQIGKGGLSEGIIKETKRLLKKHKYIKIRLLRSAVASNSKKDVFESLAKGTDSNLVGIRGNTAVLFKL